jgi:plastocyanin
MALTHAKPRAIRSSASPRPRPLLAVLLVACLAAGTAGAAGCGGQDRVRAKRGTLTMELTDFRIKPQDIRARTGTATVAIVNRGRLPHNLKVMSGDRTQIGFTTILPGARASKVRDLRRGRYDLICTVANHAELGMHGTLVVR